MLLIHLNNNKYSYYIIHIIYTCHTITIDSTQKFVLVLIFFLCNCSSGRCTLEVLNIRHQLTTQSSFIFTLVLLTKLDSCYNITTIKPLHIFIT